MKAPLPQAVSRTLTFENGEALGISHRWHGGQYCALLTRAGIVGCGIYDMATATKFDQAMAIARGTPQQPLVEPQDLLDARIVDLTPKAGSFGIQVGMSGREALSLMLKASADIGE